jgi:hypothetical protein
MSAEWLTARDVAERLKISRSAAFALMRKLPRLKLGRVTRVSEADLAAHLSANMLPPRPSITASRAEQERRSGASTAALVAHERATAKRAKSAGGASAPAVPRIKHTRARVSLPRPVSRNDPPPIRQTRQPVKLPFPVSAPPALHPEPVDYAKLQAERAAAREAAIRRLESTPASKLTGKERTAMRRLLGYEDQVRYGLRKESPRYAVASSVRDAKGPHRG